MVCTHQSKAVSATENETIEKSKMFLRDVAMALMGVTMGVIQSASGRFATLSTFGSLSANLAMDLDEFLDKA